MKRNIKPVKEEPPVDSFEINLDIINKQITRATTQLSEASKDGNISQVELDQIILELRLLEKLLICFTDEAFDNNMMESRKAFNAEYTKIFNMDANKRDGALQMLYKDHILYYLGELIRLSTKATFYGGGFSG